MRKLVRLLLLLLFVFPVRLPGTQDDVRVGIEEIRKNEFIKGNVVGLTSGGTAMYKVVVYVETNMWYIHPFERGGDGKSWASVRSDGSWKISTVLGEFPASRVAVLLVDRDAKVPATTKNVQGIIHKAIFVLDLEGTDNFGKL